MESNPNLQAVAAAVSSRRVTIIRPARSPFDILLAGLASLIRSAGLLRSMTAMRLKVRYRYSLLGWLWALLQPLALMALYAIIFSRLISYGAERLPYPLFLFPGLALWAFCSTSIATAAAGMLNHQRLMATIYFPREIIPLSYIATSLLDLVIALLILFLMMLCYSVPIAWTVLFGFPVLVILILLVTAVSLLVSSLQVRLRDISVALPLLLQVLMFTTPTVYPAAAVPANVASVYWLNPFAILVESFRQAVVGGTMPAAGALLYCTLLTIACFVAAYLAFKMVEPTIVDEI